MKDSHSGHSSSQLSMMNTRRTYSLMLLGFLRCKIGGGAGGQHTRVSCVTGSVATMGGCHRMQAGKSYGAGGGYCTRC